MYSEMFPELQT